MKRIDFIITILLIIVCTQLILSIVLLRRLNKFELQYQKVAVSEYVSNLAERAERNHNFALKYARQANWLSKRLDKCMQLIESDLQLEPIPFGPYPMPLNSNMGNLDETIKYTGPAEPFYAPLEEPNTPPDKYLTEIQLRRTICSSNLQQLSLYMLSYSLDPKIENLDRRLRRLDCKISNIDDSNSVTSEIRTEE